MKLSAICLAFSEKRLFFNQKGEREMRRITMAILIVGLPACGMFPRTSIRTRDRVADDTSEFIGGMMCIGSNVEAHYTIRRSLDDKFLIEDISPPQEQGKVDRCVVLPAGTYSISFGKIAGYISPPTAKGVNLQKDKEVVVYGYYIRSE